jgi:hypothetical protein
MIEKIKNIFVIALPLILAGILFYQFGFYQKFHIHIGNFLTIEDVLLSGFKGKYILTFIIMSIMTMAMIFGTINKKAEDIFPNWFINLHNKTIRSFRISAFITVPIAIFAAIAFIKYEIVRGVFGLFLLLILDVFLTWVVFRKLLQADNFNQIKMENWALLIMFILGFYIAIPFSVGYKFAETYRGEKVIMRFKNGAVINCADTSASNFIGRTKDYLFIFNNRSNSTNIYRSDEVISLEYLPPKSVNGKNSRIMGTSGKQDSAGKIENLPKGDSVKGKAVLPKKTDSTK